MLNRDLTLLGTLDNGLTKGLCALLGGITLACLWGLGLLSLVQLPIRIFEHGEGLADLSQAEWLFSALFALLVWRHKHYCTHFGIGFWRSFSVFLIAQGLMFAFVLTCLGVVVFSIQDVDGLQQLAAFMQQQTAASKLVALGACLLAAYLGAPTAQAVLTQPQQASPAPQQAPSSPQKAATAQAAPEVRQA